MKTIKDLRDLLSANGGKIKLGSLMINTSQNEREDIDFHFDNRLLTWIRKVENDDDLLEKSYTSLNGDFDTSSLQKDNSLHLDRISSLEVELQSTKKEMDKALLLVRNSELALGKVDAYEKILLGRHLTVSA